MKKQLLFILSIVGLISLGACQNSPETESTEATTETTEQPAGGGQSAVNDEVSQPNVVKVAIGSKDHTTLVAAVKAAELVDALSNNGPFTVFAPTNAAFDALPAGTVDNLLKPENKDQLQTVLYNHVLVGVFKAESFQDGQTVTMFGGAKVKVSLKDGKVFLGNSAIVASVPASNGIVHVVDAVFQ
ncbi:MAG TPA: fasciclin domain-containing protein [Bacteroidia bacterium]|nr:fasciclin domain-containing protein [Bacteroidia bacterium]